MTDASQLRKDILAARNNLTANEIAEKSRVIQSILLGMDTIRESRCIFVYVSFRSEVATEILIDELLEMGKIVTVPITRVAEKRLDAVRITSRDVDLVPGYCNIPEPKEEVCARAAVNVETIDTIFLPGSVFDRRGGRFGYGGGYYDRFVSSVPSATRIGLAFDLQIVDQAPLAPHDELLDLVVTESRVIFGHR